MNNPRNRNLLFIIAFLLLTNIGMLVYFLVIKEPCVKQQKKEEQHRPGMSDFLKNELGFDQQQMAAFDTLKKQQRGSMRPFFEELNKSKDSLYQLVGSSSDSAIQAAVDAVGNKQEVLEFQFFENFRAIRSICTEAQRPKFDSMAPSIIRRMMSPQRKPGAPKKDSTKTSK
jgi:periplasmic protein CpxP/Spy